MILLIDKAIQQNWSLYTGETKTNPDTVGKNTACLRGGGSPRGR